MLLESETGDKKRRHIEYFQCATFMMQGGKPEILKLFSADMAERDRDRERERERERQTDRQKEKRF